LRNGEEVEWSMKRTFGVIGTAIAMAVGMMTSAVADYPPSPSPTSLVQGAGSSAGSTGGGTAFTGGDITVAVIALVALGMVGLVALSLARRARSNRAS
jgi:hypothetical protein